MSWGSVRIVNMPASTQTRGSANTIPNGHTNGHGHKRAIRIANCSGAAPMDWGYHMHRQATAGEVDAITGDYLAEMNLAANAVAVKKGTHPGYQQTALDGLLMTLPVIHQKRLKVVINGGALNPKGLAEAVSKAAEEQSFSVKVAWVEGDNLLDRAMDLLHPETGLQHLDSDNRAVQVHETLESFLQAPKDKPIVSANCYLGARGIVKALENGADVVICGRVADASPVIGLAMWWHGWTFDDHQEIAGTLLAGHLIECSGYVTGANFSGFQQYPLSTFVDVGYGIAEVEHDGTCIITKHEELNGVVNVDTVRAQLVYELQGNIYLNNDVQADLHGVQVEEVGENRVRVSGVRGFPPPPTTKFAVFYHGGYQAEVWIACTGTTEVVEAKAALFEKQVRYSMNKAGLAIDVLEFQLFGRPQRRPVNEFAGTAMLRVFAQAATLEDMVKTGACIDEFAFGMQHFSGMHGTDYGKELRPSPFNVYYPALIPQSEIRETVRFLDGTSIAAGYPTNTMPVSKRESYETQKPVDLSTQPFGPVTERPVGDVVLARSGDKGGNLNVGFWVHEDDEYEWLKTLLTKDTIVEWLKGDWKPGYYIERVEFQGVKAVHFVIYGILGRGVSSSIILDNLGKGWADYLRSKLTQVPDRFAIRYHNWVEGS